MEIANSLQGRRCRSGESDKSARNCAAIAGVDGAREIGVLRAVHGAVEIERVGDCPVKLSIMDQDGPEWTRRSAATGRVDIDFPDLAGIAGIEFERGHSESRGAKQRVAGPNVDIVFSSGAGGASRNGDALRRGSKAASVAGH